MRNAGSNVFYALGCVLEKSGKMREAGEQYINGAFIEKDKAIAHKMNRYGRKLCEIEHDTGLDPNPEGEIQKKSEAFSQGDLIPASGTQSVKPNRP